MTNAAGRRRVRRTPHVVCTWEAGGRVVQSARCAAGVPASVLVLDVLDRLDTWVGVATLAAALDLTPPVLAVLLDGLEAHDLIEGDDPDVPTGAALLRHGPWAHWSPAAHLFHVATRDVPFARAEPAVTADAASRPAAVLPPRGGTDVSLPLPIVGDATWQQVLRARRTHRRFGSGPISLQALGSLLGITFGVQAWAHAEEGPLALKTSPSGGARHSLEAYVWVRDVEGVAAARYHYRPGDHVLSPLGPSPNADRVTRWLPTQSAYDGASIVIALASELSRVAWRYRSARAYRVVLIEAGHLAQTFCLTATALGLAPFCTAALADSVIEADLGIDGSSQPVLYVVGAGPLASGAWQPHAGRPAPRLEVTSLGRALAGDAVTARSSGPPRPPRRARAR